MQHFSNPTLIADLKIVELTAVELLARLRSSAGAEELSAIAGVSGVVVHEKLRSTTPVRPQCPVIATHQGSVSDLVDVRLEPGQSLNALTNGIMNSSIAAATLVGLTRVNARNSVPDALVAESLAYSALQHSEQFETWLATKKPGNAKVFTLPPILAERQDDHLTLTLNRPENRNAWSTDMRDALAEQLQLALDDASIVRIKLCANGPSFGSGGDLTEFGSARDAGIAHLSRQSRSPALLMHLLRNKITAIVHGACVGAGIELPAYATKVEAHPNAFFQLPEVRFGLIPGAGGTASILQRIGRSRFNYLALSGERIDAVTALSWHLIDKIT